MEPAAPLLCPFQSEDGGKESRRSAPPPSTQAAPEPGAAAPPRRHPLSLLRCDGISRNPPRNVNHNVSISSLDPSPFQQLLVSFCKPARDPQALLLLPLPLSTCCLPHTLHPAVLGRKMKQEPRELTPLERSKLLETNAQGAMGILRKLVVSRSGMPQRAPPDCIGHAKVWGRGPGCWGAAALWSTAASHLYPRPRRPNLGAGCRQ